MNNIRNFCIIAHIDHGKSTIADRLLEYTNTIQITEGQMLDDMDLEKERGITIKSHAIQMEYEKDGKEYLLNLIDTPGHVDFSYEVSRSIAACEGALLIVDATQGVQAQTISNLYMAIDHSLEIIPVINKIDMPAAMPDEVEDEIIDLMGCDREDILRASGKTGEGVKEILDAVVDRIPCPKGNLDAPLQALIFDSVFNSFRGIIAYFKIENGSIRKGDKVKFFNTGMEYTADEVGVLKMDMVPRQEMKTGEVGYIISGIKDAKEVKVGDTITHIGLPCDKAIEGFQEVKPMVFAGVYPIDPTDYENLRASLEKLQLNDASLSFMPESSVALGFGFRCGFLGLLHMEIVQERLDREFNMDVITTVPNVSYMVFDKQGNSKEVHNPSGLPDQTMIDHIEEPYIRASIITDANYIGPIMRLCLDKRGELIKQEYVSGNRVELHFYIPLGEIVIDFYDKLKSISKGYASFDYHIDSYRPSKLVKLDILLNGEPVERPLVLTTTFKTFDYGFSRQMHLVEQFTSTWCTYCPQGTANIEALTQMRDDIAWVAVHENMGNVDPFRTAQCDSITDYEGIDGFPEGSFNRATGISNASSVYAVLTGLSATTMSTFLDYVAEDPSWATVNINSAFDAETREAVITIDGELVPNFDEMMGSNCKLTVYLTEDGLVAPQTSGGNDYVHNNVLRLALGSIKGVDMNRTSETTYKNEFTYTIPSEWNADNMHIVAFIGRPLRPNALTDIYVTNTNMRKLGESDEPAVLVGDVDGNGIVSIDDVTELITLLLNGTEPANPAAADVYPDGRISIDDVVDLINLLLNASH